MKPIAAKIARDIDSACARSAVRYEKPVTRQVAYDRRIIYDRTQTNSVLFKILRKEK